MATLTTWEPDDRAFWRRDGARIARRNLAVSIPALVVAFAVWGLMSAVVVYLPRAGFAFTTTQLFWLVALPALAGATLRLVFAWPVAVWGGRRWTAFATAALALPAGGLAVAAQSPDAGFATFAVIAIACGLGGGNFASSMAHISHFFPADQKGLALGLNAGLGNLGIALAQFAVPVVVAGALQGAEEGLRLPNAGLLWIPLIALTAVAAWAGLDDVARARASVREQAMAFRRRQTATVCWLYLGTFGSWIGYSAAMPLLVESQFPGANALHYAFIGPLAGALARPAGGWLADQAGSARVTFWNFVAMAAAAAGAFACLPGVAGAGSLGGFVAFSFALFVTAGLGNGAVFRLIPAVFAAEAERRAERGGASSLEISRLAATESAAAMGIASAVGAYGGFFIPMLLAASLEATGGAAAAHAAFVAFYATALWVTRRAYLRADARDAT